MKGTRNRVLHGALWLIGTQGAGFILQFAYAAMTARLVDVDDFGTYAIALASVGVVNVLANAGIGQSVLRTDQIDLAQYRSLSSLALCVGCLAAAVVALTAPVWSNLWGGGSVAVAPIRWLAVSCLVAPFIGFATAILRRSGNFRAIAVSQLFCNFAGMTVGGFLVYEFRSPSALVGNLVLTQLFLVIFLIFRCRLKVLPGIVRRSTLAHLSFSTQVTATNLLYYVQQNMPKLAIGRFLGASSLGVWNRSEVLTAVPFQAVQVALLQTVYPEFRKTRGDPSAARRIWSDMLVLSAIALVPAGFFLSTAMPSIVAVLYGESWRETGNLAAILVCACAVIPTTSLLAAGLEATGLFRQIYLSQIVCILVEGLMLVAVFSFGSLSVAVYAYATSLVIRHVLQIFIAVKYQLIIVKKVLLGYAQAVAFSGVLYGSGILIVKTSSAFGYGPVGCLVLFAAFGIIICVAVLVISRTRFRSVLTRVMP